MRWYFGGCGIGYSKVSVLCTLLRSIHPEIHINGVNENINSRTLIEEMELSDLIIFTIGSSDQQLVFNRALHYSKCKKPVIFIWLEAGGHFSHLLVVNYLKPGCFECLFTNESGKRVNNRANINKDKRADDYIIKNGCGGVRAAYGTAVLLRTTAVLLETINEIIACKIQDSTLITIEPNKVYVSSDIIPMEECNCCGNRK